MAGGAVRVMNEVREAYGVVYHRSADAPRPRDSPSAALLAKCRVTRQAATKAPPPQKHAVRYGRAKYGARKLRQGGSGGKGHQRS